jgi:hypothetical protein
VTIAGAANKGYVTVWATGRNRPETSNTNAERPGDVVAGLAVPPMGPGGQLSVYSSGGSEIVIDRVGWFLG